MLQPKTRARDLGSDVGDVTETGQDIIDGDFGDRGAPFLPPPNVTEPEPGAVVGSPVHVAGTASPGATVAAELLLGDQQLGSGEMTAAEFGEFSVTVEFTGAEPGDSLVLQAILSNHVGDSDPTQVNVTYLPREIGGTISQADGLPSGTEVYVQLFPSKVPILACRRSSGTWDFETSVCDGGTSVPSITDFSAADEWIWQLWVGAGCDISSITETETAGVYDTSVFAGCLLEHVNYDRALGLTKTPLRTFRVE